MIGKGAREHVPFLPPGPQKTRRWRIRFFLALFSRAFFSRAYSRRARDGCCGVHILFLVSSFFLFEDESSPLSARFFISPTRISHQKKAPPPQNKSIQKIVSKKLSLSPSALVLANYNLLVLVFKRERERDRESIMSLNFSKLLVEEIAKNKKKKNEEHDNNIVITNRRL